MSSLINTGEEKQYSSKFRNKTNIWHQKLVKPAETHETLCEIPGEFSFANCNLIFRKVSCIALLSSKAYLKLNTFRKAMKKKKKKK